MSCPELTLARAADVRHIQKHWALCAKTKNMLEVCGSSWYVGLIDCTPVWLICQSSSANHNHTWSPLGTHTIHGSRSVWTFWTFFPENHKKNKQKKNIGATINIQQLNIATAVQVQLAVHEHIYWTSSPSLLISLFCPFFSVGTAVHILPKTLSCLSAPLGTSWAGHCHSYLRTCNGHVLTLWRSSFKWLNMTQKLMWCVKHPYLDLVIAFNKTWLVIY